MPKRIIFLFLLFLIIWPLCFADEKIPAAWEDLTITLTDDVPLLQAGALSDHAPCVLVIPPDFRTELDLTDALEGSRIRWIINRSDCRLTVPDGVDVYPDFSLTGIRAGRTILFGHYPQKTDGNDRTPIEWIVMEVDGSRALLVSRYGLDCCQYHDKNLNVMWRTCTLRKWLNTVFMNRAFTEGEQSAILLTTLNNGQGQHLDYREVDSEKFGYSRTYKDYDETYDRLFIPSYFQAQHWFGLIYPGRENEDACLKPTDYAVTMGAETDGVTAEGEDAGSWWVRSPGATLDYATLIQSNGDPRQAQVTERHVMVRPCLWLDLRKMAE